MRLRVQIHLLTNTADAVAVRDWLAGRIAVREQENVDPLTITDGKVPGTSSVNYQGYVSASAVAVAFLDEVEQRWTQGPARDLILPGSTIRWHECRHDDGTGNCQGAVGGFAEKA